MTTYFTADFPYGISDEALRESDRDTQIGVMEEWFHRNFEDPAERTPYESREGGYIWIWGGPYDAEEELGARFGGVVPDDLIEELARALTKECWEWAPRFDPDYAELVRDAGEITRYRDNFATAIDDIETLLETDVDERVRPVLLRMLYVGVITALETYLSDAFINSVVNERALMRRFIESNPAFREEKVSVSEIFAAMEEIEKKAKAHLLDVVWHHLARIKPMFWSTLNVEFPPDLQSIFQAVRIRHDLVHRNGKTKEGNEIPISKPEIENLMQEAERFVEYVDEQIAALRAGIIKRAQDGEKTASFE